MENEISLTFSKYSSSYLFSSILLDTTNEKTYSCWSLDVDFTQAIGFALGNSGFDYFFLHMRI